MRVLSWAGRLKLKEDAFAWRPSARGPVRARSNRPAVMMRQLPCIVGGPCRGGHLAVFDGSQQLHKVQAARRRGSGAARFRAPRLILMRLAAAGIFGRDLTLRPTLTMSTQVECIGESRRDAGHGSKHNLIDRALEFGREASDARRWQTAQRDYMEPSDDASR